jgi:glycosyltransferase involved in cell wall biosynthesis
MVLPSDFEPWALVVNEAAAAGLAIIATDKVGAAAELVRDGVNGFIFPASDLAKLTDRLLEVTDDSRIEELKAGSAGVLNEWRRVADPVNGLRQALASCGVLQ